MASAKPGMAIGLDLGGTKIQAAVVDRDGGVLASHRRETNVAAGPFAVVDDLIDSVRTLLRFDPEGIRTVGVGVAGQVDSAVGLVRSAPNLKWKDVPLGETLERALGLPVFVDNDVRAATWGEWRHGAGRGIEDLVVLFVGTGVGGGIVSGGRVLTGDRGLAGELGHLTIVAGGRQCSCPNRGCLEAYAGGWAIAERANEAVAADPKAGRVLAARAAGGDVTARDVAEAAAEGDSLAQEIMAETGRFLGAGVVGMVHAFNPRRIVLGGGVVEGNPGLVETVNAAIRSGVIPVFAENLEVRRSELGGGAGVVGSASLALGRLGD
ncbi:MAG: ROK family protein [Gemmatimonadota bacterium]